MLLRADAGNPEGRGSLPPRSSSSLPSCLCSGPDRVCHTRSWAARLALSLSANHANQASGLSCNLLALASPSVFRTQHWEFRGKPCSLQPDPAINNAARGFQIIPWLCKNNNKKCQLANLYSISRGRDDIFLPQG